MGFLKFLKREKKKADLDELDLPPAPPPLGGFEENIDIPDFSDFDKGESSVTDDGFSKFDFPEIEDKSIDLGMEVPQAFSDLQKIGEGRVSITPITAVQTIPAEITSAPVIPQPQQITPEIKEEPGIAPQDIYPKKERRLFSHEKKGTREMLNVKTVYVRVDDFKVALGGVNILRNDLRKSEESLTKLENIKNSKDKSFDRMKSSLEDLQHKLIFIDKTLFKGE